MRRLSLLVLYAFCSLCCWAQKGYVRGEVSDAYLQEALPEVTAALLRTDSSVVDRAESKYQVIMDKDMHGNVSGTADRYSGAEFRLKVPAEGDYILRLSRVGYETKYANLSVKFSHRMQTFDAGGFVLFPKAKALGQAVVKATRIKMYHNGDTLIYNADAFKTADGSMLDELVAQLPGVEMRDGRIYAQGKFVESILISGKDFFRGDPNAALKNLPAYVVSKLKFYDKSGEMSETMGRDLNDKSYVMDVHLKREYRGTWLLNPSLGYGTHGRYEGMLFLMRFDDRQDFTLSADINNVGKVREENELCTTSEDFTDRRLTNQYVKASYYIEPSSKFRLSAAGGFKHQSYRMDDETSSETYLPSGNLFTRERNKQKSGSTSAQGDIMAALRPVKGRFLKLNYSMDYTKHHQSSTDRMAGFTANPDGLVAGSALDSAFAGKVPVAIAPLLTYKLLQEQLQDGHDLTQKARAEAQLALGNNLLKFSFDWSDQHKRNERKQSYDLRYPNSSMGTDEWQRRYYDVTSNDRAYKVGAEFFRKYADTEARSGEITLDYTYGYNYTSNLNWLYLLDRLSGWGKDTDQPLAALPSARDSLLQCVDVENSYEWQTKIQRHTLSANWLHEWRFSDSTWLKIHLNFPITQSHRTLSYSRNGAQYPVTTDSWLVDPSLTLSYMPVANDRSGNRSRWTLAYKEVTDEPSLLYFPTLRDAADPLNVSRGNAHLKNAQTHGLALAYRYYNPKNFSHVETKISYAMVHNALAMQSIYNTQTGVRTYQPVNINGNYAVNGDVSFNMPLDKNKKFLLSNNLQGIFNRAVDLNNTDGEEASSQKEYVKNIKTSDEIGLTFNPNRKLRLATTVRGAYNHIYSNQEDFTSIDVWDVRYSLRAEADLPLRLHLSTNFNISTRYGYSNGAYDRSEYLWNAVISRSWLKEKLGVSLELSDILNSRKRISSELNAWGRVERYTRLSTPAYVMLHARYRFSFSKKK